MHTLSFPNNFWTNRRILTTLDMNTMPLEITTYSFCHHLYQHGCRANIWSDTSATCYMALTFFLELLTFKANCLYDVILFFFLICIVGVGVQSNWVHYFSNLRYSMALQWLGALQLKVTIFASHAVHTEAFEGRLAWYAFPWTTCCNGFPLLIRKYPILIPRTYKPAFLASFRRIHYCFISTISLFILNSSVSVTRFADSCNSMIFKEFFNCVESCGKQYPVSLCFAILLWRSEYLYSPQVCFHAVGRNKY
jgi:hypothetical protein